MNRVTFVQMLSLVLLGSVISSCNRSAPANVAAMVNGRAITYAELEKQYESQFAGPRRTSERRSDP